MELIFIIALVVITCGSCMTLCIMIIKMGSKVLVNSFDNIFPLKNNKQFSNNSIQNEPIPASEESQVVPDIDFVNKYAPTKFCNNLRSSDRNWEVNFGKKRYHIVEHLN